MWALLYGLSFLPGICCSVRSLQHHNFLQGTSTRCNGCPPQAVLPWSSMGYVVTIYVTMVCRRICALVPGAPHPPHFSPTSLSAGLFFSHILTPFSQLQLHRAFLSIIKHISSEVLPLLLIYSALDSGDPSWSQLKLSNMGAVPCVFSENSPLKLSSCPLPPPTPPKKKPPNHQTNKKKPPAKPNPKTKKTPPLTHKRSTLLQRYLPYLDNFTIMSEGLQLE